MMLEVIRQKEGIKREIVGVVVQSFSWDPEFIPFQVETSVDNRQVYLTEEDYLFRTVFGSKGFTEGIHYWEIVADARSEHEIKTGVSKCRDVN
jgi:hypothetical protein